MSLDLFRLAGGIDIQNDALTSNAYILQGSGEPGGDSSFQDAAPIGSIYIRTDSSGNTLQQYYKFTTANSTSADWQVVASKQYVDDAVVGLSWREPAIVRSDVTTLPTTTGGDPITVDGESITDGQRVLFSNLTVNPNVYIYDQATGTFIEDSNTASAGDALFITDGTSASQRWTYNGATSSWVLFGASTDVSEFDYINTFIGKTSVGDVTPTYTSEYALTDAQSLVTSLDAIDLLIGDGTITNQDTDYVLTDDLATAGTNGLNGTYSITAALDAINTAIGQRDYTTGTGYPIASDSESIATSLEALNLAIYALNQSIKGSVSTDPEVYATADTVAFADASEVKWIVQVRDTATPGNIRAVEVHAVTDGTTVDFTRYAETILGDSVAGFGLQVIISGTDIVLQLKATNNYDFAIKRVAQSKF